MWVIVRAIRRNDGKWFYRWPIVQWSRLFGPNRSPHAVRERVVGWRYIPIGRYQTRHGFRRWFTPGSH